MNYAVAIVGMGLMGRAFAQRLSTLGWLVASYNRGAGLEDLYRKSSHQTPADIYLLTLSNDAAVLDVAQQFPSLPGKIIINASTISPQVSRQAAQLFMAKGFSYIEAPVLGSQPEARSGKLLWMLAGNRHQVESLAQFWQASGSQYGYFGDYEKALTVKLAMNQLIASLTTAFAFSLTLVQKAGVPVEDFMALLRPSALYAPTYDKKLQRFVDEDYTQPNFPTEHLLKDILLVKNLGEQQGLDTDFLSAMAQIAQRSIHQGHVFEDYAALKTGLQKG